MVMTIVGSFFIPFNAKKIGKNAARIIHNLSTGPATEFGKMGVPVSERKMDADQINLKAVEPAKPTRYA